MAEFRTLLYRKRGSVAYISLNRPKVHNAYNMEMRDEIFQVLKAVGDDAEVGVAILKGEGRSFCAGADLTEFGSAPSPAIARSVRWERDVWGAFMSISKPLIAAIHGYCLGSGVEMALLCDIRVASEDTIFGMPEVALGMIPAAGGTQTLPRYLGTSRALELLLTGRRLNGMEALRLGLVSAVVTPDRLESEAEAVASHLISLDPGLVRAVKEAVWRGLDLSLDRALGLEASLVAQAKASGLRQGGSR